jgi:hypothetical protein
LCDNVYTVLTGIGGGWSVGEIGDIKWKRELAGNEVGNCLYKFESVRRYCPARNVVSLGLEFKAVA